MQTRDQKYAAKAYIQVADLLMSMTPEDQRKYGSIAHKLPVLVRSAGLAQALAFVDARLGEPQWRLLEHLSEAVGTSGRADLLQRSRAATMLEYARLTRDVLAALEWYKRFAQSVLHVETAEDGGAG